jgi:hypothetical protein
VKTRSIDPSLVTVELTAHECDLIARALYAHTDRAVETDAQLSQIQSLSDSFELASILAAALSHLPMDTVTRLREELKPSILA